MTPRLALQALLLLSQLGSGPGVGGQAVLAAAPPGPCDAGPYLGLDFWVGEWEVTVGGSPAGTNRIVKILGGCAIEEHWQSVTGSRGQSLFYYVPAADEWRQVWVTEDPGRPGGVKEKRQVRKGAAPVFQGEVTLPDGRRWLDRTTLTPLGDGRVRQLIEISSDGQSWSVTFDGIYARVGSTGRGERG